MTSRIVALVAIVLTLLSVFSIFFFIISRKKQNQHVITQKAMEREFREQLLKAQIEVQETTYSVIGKELHDNVGQLLSTTKMLLGVAELNMKTPPDSLVAAGNTLKQAIQELRSVSRSLDKEWLEQFRFIENITSEIKRINAGEVIQASFLCNTQILLPTEKQIILYRVVQEAIQNSIKHGDITELLITVSGIEESLQVEIKDNGKGLQQEYHGMGMTNMKSRIRLLEGMIVWQSFGGTIVTITLPQ